MKYRFIYVDIDINTRQYNHISSYVDSTCGLTYEEIEILDKKKVNNFEEAINVITNTLNLKLITVYKGVNINGFPRNVFVFEEMERPVEQYL